jgi:hypothetical protein
MNSSRVLLMAVDNPVHGIRIIRLMGDLDATGAARLMRLIDAQAQLVRSGRCEIAHLVLDLSPVSSFVADAMQTLRHVEYVCEQVGIRLHLAGFLDRSALLPSRVRQELIRFDVFPTTEVAVTALRRVDGVHDVTPGANALAPPTMDRPAPAALAACPSAGVRYNGNRHPGDAATGSDVLPQAR